ncbi:MAG TPA: hypothetical protein PLB32_14740, partial [Acidobacteriota bacterium]|nr:hypothetical protein [Acidobacteriota bacterium]
RSLSALPKKLTVRLKAFQARARGAQKASDCLHLVSSFLFFFSLRRPRTTCNERTQQLWAYH